MATDVAARAVDNQQKLLNDQERAAKSRTRAPRIKSERRKSFELALSRGHSQELLQTQPEGAKEVKGDFQVRSKLDKQNLRDSIATRA